MGKFEKYSFSKKSDELKKLILENPDLSIVVLTGEEANNCYYGWMFCTDIYFEICEVLNCNFTGYNDEVFTDREKLEDYIDDVLYDEYHDKTDEEYNAAINKKLNELEPYWEKVIAIYATN